MTALLASVALLPNAFALKDGDRVLFYGDSITEQRLYTTYVEAFVRTRYPNLKAEFVSSGVGGDCTWGGWTAASDERVKRDVAPEKPTVVTILLGMNDGGYVSFDPKIFAVFQEWYGKLLGWMNASVPQAKLTLMSSPPYDDWAHPDTDFKGYSDTVRRFGDYVGVLAKERKLGFVDMNGPLTSFIQWAVKKDPKQAKQICPDAIHPGPAGHLAMACQLLQHWGVSEVVSEVEIDVALGKVVRSENASITNLKDLQWTQLDRSLPYPVEPGFALAAEYLDFANRFNRQIVKVTGLKPGSYRLEIDGEKVGAFSAEDWSKGINLSTLKTPMLKQAAQVLDLTVQRNNAYFLRWRELDFNLKGYSSSSTASKAMRQLTDEIGDKQKKAAQPKAHVFKLVAG